jgi:hypothetical protein
MARRPEYLKNDSMTPEERGPSSLCLYLSESSRDLNLGKVREVKSNALETAALNSFGPAFNWKMDGK